MSRSDSIPRYLEIEGAIRRDIESGHFPVGTDLPTEFELCDAYEASRFTIREALRRIEAAGYIARHQGRASRVIARAPRQTLVLSGPSDADRLVYITGTTVTFKLLQKPMPQKLAQELEIADPEEWIHYSGVRRRAETGQPVTVFDVYLRREYEIPVDAIDHAEERPILSRVFERYGLQLTHMDEMISATRLPARIARLLDAEPGDAGLRIVRRSMAEDVGMFEVAVSYNPADRFQYHVRAARPDRVSAIGEVPVTNLQAGVVQTF